MYRTSVSGLAETSGSAEGVKDSILSFSGGGIRRGRKHQVCLGLAAAYSLEVVGTTAVVALQAVTILVPMASGKILGD